MMKRLILLSICALFYLDVVSQNGNVGIGTISPESKLHVDGDVRIDDNLEIKDSSDGTVFIMNPNTKRFEILDELGNVFFRVGPLDSDTSNLVVKGNSNSRSSNTQEPTITFEYDEFGGMLTTVRRPDGTKESEQYVSSIAFSDVSFYPDGVTPRRSHVQGGFTAADIITDYDSDGFATKQTIKEIDGSFVEILFHADGETPKSAVTVLTSPTNQVISEKFDENGDLIDKEVIESGLTKFFDSDDNEVASMEMQNGYTKTIMDPASGYTNTYNAAGNIIQDTDTGDKTEIMPANVQIDKDDLLLNLNNVGFDVLDSESGLQFFMDLFGISKFEGTSFVGLDFDALDGGVDIFGDCNIDGMLSKSGGSFKIDHPLDPTNKFLYHSFVESPDMMNVYNGNITTNRNGEAVVELPDYFEVLNKDFRYQLTVIGSFAQAIVWKKVENNQFVIKSDQPNVEVSWQVTGIRDDEFARANRIKVEVEKRGYDKGNLLFDPNREGPYSANMRKHWESSKRRRAGIGDW